MKLVYFFIIYAFSSSTFAFLSSDKDKFKTLTKYLTSLGVNSEEIISRNQISSEYTELNYQWNSYKGTIYPLGFIKARNVADVQATVKCCKKYKIRLVNKSGGHSFEKCSFGNSHSVVLDLKGLNKVQIEPSGKFASIGPGNNIARVQYKLLMISSKRKDNSLLPAGLCPHVGIGGLALGGGYGFFSQSYGLLSDNIVELEMVDANGKLLKINEKSNPDLLWAHRGTGGGNFGIVTNFKFKIYQAPKVMIFGQINFSVDQFPQFFTSWQSMVTTLNDTTISLYPYIKGEPGSILMLLLTKSVASKPDLNSAMQHVKTILKVFPTPINSNISTYSYEQFLVIIAKQFGNPIINNVTDLLNVPKYPTRYNKMKSFFMDKVLVGSQVIDFYIQLRKFLAGHGSIVILQSYGTVINSIGRTETAFVHRGNKKDIFYDVGAYIKNSDGNTIGNTKSILLLDEFYNDTKLMFNHTESYQNYIDGELEDYLKRYYAENLPRLVKIKRKVDPNNIFNHPMSIPTKLTNKC